MNTPRLTSCDLDWEPRRDERRDADFRRSLAMVVAIGGSAVAAGIGALAVLHVGITPKTVALCAAPLVGGLAAFLALAPIEARARK